MHFFGAMVEAMALGQLESVDPAKLAAGLSTSLPVALAWVSVILLLLLVATNAFWVKAYLAQVEARFSDQREAQSQTLSTLTSVVTLGLKNHEGLEIVRDVMDHVAATRRDGG